MASRNCAPTAVAKALLHASYIVTTHGEKFPPLCRRAKGAVYAGMKSRIAKAGLIAAELAGVAVAAVLGLAAFIAWRAQSGPVDLGWAAPAFKSAANAAAFDGAVRRIGDITLEKLDDKGGYRLRFADVSLGKAKSEATAIVPAIAADLYPRDFLSGKAGPRRILFDGAELRIVRRADRRIKVDFGEAGGEGDSAIRSLTGGAYFREAFERAELRRVRINFVDEGSGRTWRGENAAAFLARSAEGYDAALEASFDIGGSPASIDFKAAYALDTDLINATVDLKSAPVGDLLAFFYEAPPDLFTSLVSGRAGLRMKGDGTLVASAIDLAAGKGTLRLGGAPAEVESLSVRAAFDPAQNIFDIKRATIASSLGAGTVSGKAQLALVEGARRIDTISFDIAGEGVSLSPPNLFPAPLVLDAAAIKGHYALEARALDLQSVTAVSNGLMLSGGVFFALAKDKSPTIRGALKLDGAIDVARLLSIWPPTLAQGARTFVDGRIPAATFSALDFKIDLAAGAIGEDGVPPEEAMTLSFAAEDAVVEYAPGMTPLRKVRGRGVLKGNSFRFEAERGDANGVAVTEGLVDIPVIVPKGELARFSFRARGGARNIMEVLAEPPLAILKETKLLPAQFSGAVDARVTISRPNLSIAPPDSYRYDGVARFSDLGVDAVFADVDLDKASGVLTLKTDGLAVKAKGALASAPVTIDWRQRFYGTGDKTLLELAGVADSGAADLFGVPSRQLVQGDVAFKAVAKGELSAFRTLDVEADFLNAAIVVERLDWVKPKGVAARGRAALSFGAAGLGVNGLLVEGDGLRVEGEAAFAPDGALLSALLPVFRLDGAADLSLSAARAGAGALQTTATGRYLNAGALVREIVEGGLGADAAGADQGAIALAARIERLDLRSGASWRDASLDFRRAGGAIEALSLSAIDDQQNTLAIALRPTGEGALTDQSIDARTDNIGNFMAGVFGVTSIKGGRGHLALDLSAADGAARPGVIEASGLRVVNAPILAKIFAAGSLSGLVNLVNGEGIELSKAYAAFTIDNGAVRISEARATGPSVGISAQGAFDLRGAGQFDLSGAVAPAYQVNSILGRAPVIGDLFVNRDGEGLLAISYRIDGSSAEPRVTVNPLSALAPGVFRRMFEGGRDDAAPPKAE